MLFEPKILVILLFIIINLIIIFAIKTRTTITTTLIIAHLILILFLSTSITNYQSYKEIVLTLIVYLMVMLSLISNYHPTYLNNHSSASFKPLTICIILIIPAFISCSAIFFLAKSITPMANLLKEKQAIITTTDNSSAKLTQKSSLDTTNNTSNINSSNAVNKATINNYKITRLKKKLSDNFLLKRSSDVILVIAGFITGLLLLKL
jgi:glucan phosphoethanolaminetransferase (alkaline phosphatase superfamily)